MAEGYIEFSENNSGGSFWLSEENYQALKDIGWEGEGIVPGERYAGRTLTRTGVSRRVALAEFEDATGWSPYEEGCDCCGQPFNFYEYDENGKMIW